MAPLLYLLALALECLGIKSFPEALLLLLFAVEPGICVLPWLRSVGRKLYDFEVLEFFVHGSIDYKVDSGAEG